MAKIKKMQSGGKTSLGMKSVKAGFDKNPGVTRADIIVAAKKEAKYGKKIKKAKSGSKIKKAQGGRSVSVANRINPRTIDRLSKSDRFGTPKPVTEKDLYEKFIPSERERLVTGPQRTQAADSTINRLIKEGKLFRNADGDIFPTDKLNPPRMKAAGELKRGGKVAKKSVVKKSAVKKAVKKK